MGDRHRKWRQTERDKQADRDRERQTDTEADRQTDRQRQKEVNGGGGSTGVSLCLSYHSVLLSAMQTRKQLYM